MKFCYAQKVQAANLQLLGSVSAFSQLPSFIPTAPENIDEYIEWRLS
jgi:hypothetical protein